MYFPDLSLAFVLYTRLCAFLRLNQTMQALDAGNRRSVPASANDSVSERGTGDSRADRQMG